MGGTVKGWRRATTASGAPYGHCRFGWWRRSRGQPDLVAALLDAGKWPACRSSVREGPIARIFSSDNSAIAKLQQRRLNGGMLRTAKRRN